MKGKRAQYTLEIVVTGALSIRFNSSLLDIVARPNRKDAASDNVNQMIGPWQMPVADCAITLAGYEGFTGEAMSIGRNFTEALQKAMRSLEQKGSTFDFARPEVEMGPHGIQRLVDATRASTTEHPADAPPRDHDPDQVHGSRIGDGHLRAVPSRLHRRARRHCSLPHDDRRRCGQPRRGSLGLPCR